MFTPNHDWRQTLAHGLHVLHQTKTGRAAIHAATGTALALGSAIAGPVVGPAAVMAAATYGLWHVFKK